MKTTNNFMMTGFISQILNSICPKDAFDREVQAEASFNYAKLLFDNGYPPLAMGLMLVDFKSKYPQSRHATEAQRMLASIYSPK